MERPWTAYQERLRAAGGTALLVTRAAAAAAVGGHERIAVYQSDPPFPSVFLPLEGAPHVCTPDPDGATHLPADHVHPVLFDPAVLAARVPEWLGDAAAGPVFVDVSSPGAYERLRAVLPGVELRDASSILGSSTPSSPREPDRSEVAAARRARFLDVAARAGVDGWSLRTPEAARAAGVEPVAHADVDALPDSGRVAVDRISLDELEELRAAHPHVEWVDSGPLVAAAALPRSAAELAVMRDGARRSERALLDALPSIEIGMTERETRVVLRAAARAVGLHSDHIDHVFRVIPRDRAAAPWLRGSWSGRAPWMQLTGEHRIAVGDHLAVDLGFWFEGAMTDVGWTLLVGREPDPGEQSLARDWLEVADRVTEAVRPGATAADLRTAALDGWTGEQPPWPFGLYVAHGVGFSGVEPPFAGTDLGIEAERAMPVVEGQVLMVEPYVFRDGAGGYRAERCLCVTADGCEVWSELPVGTWGGVG
jgi:Xaa-Pro aminopeptidase